MMSLTRPSVGQNIWQQLIWKLSAYGQAIYTIVLMQMIFTLFTFGGTGTSGGGNGTVNVQEHFYSLDFLFIISMLSFLIIGWMLATKAFTDENFTIVTTRFTAHASTGLFLVVLSALSTVTALSSLYIVVLLRRLIRTDEFMMSVMPFHLESIVVFFFAMVMMGAVGYLLSSLIYTSKLYILVIAVAGFFFIRIYGNTDKLFTFYIEGTLASFCAKSLITVIVLYGLAILVKSKKEVRGT